MNRHFTASASVIALAAVSALGAISSTAHADTFVNGSFETGDLTGWTSGQGIWNDPQNGYPVPQDYLPGGTRYVAGTTLNTITNPILDPRTDNQLNEVYAGAHSVQVNNPINDYSVSVISQRVNNYTDPIIAFAYSAVLQGSHGPTDSDAFIITLTDATTGETLYSYNLNSATAVGVFAQSNQGWYYSNWLTQSIDVSGRQGHDFILSLLANDCPYGGHAGYAYLDGFGAVVGGGGTGGTTPPPSGTFQYWDGDAAGNANNGVIDGGDGIWTATAPNWTEATGTTNGVYTPNPGSPIFAGKAGTVTVDDSAGQVAINGMTFAVDGYHVVGDSIDLGGTVATIAVGDGTANGANFVATVDAPLTGSGGITKTDIGTLVLNGVNTYTGTTTVTAGTLVGSATSFGTGAVNDNATFIILQPTDATFANPIMGVGNFIKTGAGALTLTANNAFAGSTNVDGGALLVNGNLGASAVTVNAGATLGGTGTVGSIVAPAGGIISPGAALGTIGTLTVNGNLTQIGGSTYAVNLTSTGSSDNLNVGSATIGAGANLVVTKNDSARYVLGQRYTVLTSAGPVTGAYTVSGNTHVSLFYDVVADYDPTHVYLDVAQTHAFAEAAGTPNQIAAAGGADTTITTGALHTAIGYLQTVPEARAAFDAISGEIHATARAAAFEDSRFVREAIYAHLDSATDKALWLHGYGSWGHQRGDGNAARYDRDIYGFFLGFDAVNTGQLRIGLLGGYDHSTLRLAARSSRYSADDISVGAYAALDSAGFALRAGGNYAFRKLHTHRDVSFTGFSDTDTANYTIGIAQGFGEVGYKIPAGALTIEPFANAAFVHISNGRESEIGGPAALTIEKDGADTIFTNLGGRVSLQAGTLKLTGSGAWRHAGNSRDVTIPLEFSSGSSLFTIAAPPLAKDVAAIELSAEGKIDAHTTISVGYSGQMGKGLQDHGGRATISYAF
jgi:outer membrane autotransporter protein